MDKIGFVVLNKVSSQPLKDGNIYASGEFSAGEKCSKIVAFSRDRSKAILQVWVEENETYEADIFDRPAVIPGSGFKRFERIRRKLFIEGREEDLYKRIPVKYKLPKSKVRRK